jgi:hypothetical protein
MCVLGWEFMFVCKGGHSCVCKGGHSCMCVRVGVHVCVLGWAFMCVC